VYHREHASNALTLPIAYFGADLR